MSSAKREEFSFFAGRLTELVAARKVTQARVAAAAKTSPPTLRTWLAGTNSPDIYQLILLADYFRLPTVDELVREVPHGDEFCVVPKRFLFEVLDGAQGMIRKTEQILYEPKTPEAEPIPDASQPKGRAGARKTPARKKRKRKEP